MSDVEKEMTTATSTEVPQLDTKHEAVLTRKFDIFLIPILGLLYLFSFLDRGNIGNANVSSPSMSTTLGLNATQYSAAVSVVYATYVVFEPVWANLLKVLGPRNMLSASAIAWGILTICTAWAKNYSGLLAIRILLGVFEAGLFPAISVYVFMHYRREEIGRRMSYIFLCCALSGAFGGLMAYGLVRIERRRLVGWQYLYLVEGGLSLAMGPITYLAMPSSIEKAWFLTSEQQEHAKIRLEANKVFYNPDEKFSWGEVIKGALDWKTYVTGLIEFCTDITLYGMSTFMPAIIKGMGYTNVNAQLLTVPVYAVAAIFFIVIGRLSDRLQHRSGFIALSFIFQIIGYVVLATCENVNGRYGGVYIVALGLYSVPGLNISWISNNTANHYKRTTAFGINQLLGNCAGAAIGFIYSSTLAPRYFQSLYVSIGCSTAGLLLTIGNTIALKMINDKRAKLVAQGAEDRPELGDKNPHFEYYL